MAKNTLILIDRRGDPWKKVNVTIIWKGGGRDHVWINDSGRGEFSGTGIVIEVQAPGETIPQYASVNGSSTIVAKSKNAH